MIYKDIQPGQAFTFYEMGSPRIALKLTTGDSVILKTGEIIHIRTVKKVQPLEGIDPGRFRLAYLHDRLCFVQELPNKQFYVADFLIVSTGIALRETVKLIEQRAEIPPIQPGKLPQVDIMLDFIMQNLDTLQTIVEAVKILLSPVQVDIKTLSDQISIETRKQG